jgi:hypothetical protein
METSERIILKHCNTKTNDYGTSFSSINELQCKNAMIEFAKLHVEAALKEVTKACDDELEKDFIDANLILNAYPLTLIK